MISCSIRLVRFVMVKHEKLVPHWYKLWYWRNLYYKEKCWVVQVIHSLNFHGKPLCILGKQSLWKNSRIISQLHWSMKSVHIQWARSWNLGEKAYPRINESIHDGIPRTDKIPNNANKSRDSSLAKPGKLQKKANFHVKILLLSSHFQENQTYVGTMLTNT